MPQQRQGDIASLLPAVPEEPKQEGARWRFHRPSSEAVATWFGDVPLDDGMTHERYVGGVVIIPQTEKVKYQTERGIVERHEMTYTPYVQIGTRDAYFHTLAESRQLVPVIEPVSVPRSTKPESPYFNGNMDEGLWWHIVQSGEAGPVRYLCCSYRVAMYDPDDWRWYQEKVAEMATHEAATTVPRPLARRGGVGTKQVGGGPDPNALMKAQTGAIGRALGVAGILVVGTGIATAEDMQDFAAGEDRAAPAPSLPAVPTEVPAGDGPPVPADDPDERLAQLRSEAMALQTRMQEQQPQTAWLAFAAWWKERAGTEGWKELNDVPLDPLTGIVQRMHNLLAEHHPEAAS